jgi:ribosomal protein S18 acetylase RimI-like enzyme
MSFVRPFRPGDEPALGEICVRTADAGDDASGLLADDAIWPAIFVWPYVAHDPDTAFVVEADDGRVVGYIVATEDTDAFGQWFRTRWWPPYASRWPLSATTPARDADLLGYAAARGSAPDRLQAHGYPAHLHIDLLPELQGQGWGRRLIGTLVEHLRGRGVTGIQLTASADNHGAAAFYPRVGFDPLASDDGGRSFGLRLVSG